MKFAQTLATHVTPEWRTQYVDYDLMKEMLYEAVDAMPSSEAAAEGEVDDKDYDAFMAKFHQEFFTYSERELTKVNTFFSEKLSENVRKFATLKNGLKYFQFRDILSDQSEGKPNLSTRRPSKMWQRTEREATRHFRKANDLKLAFSEFYLSLVLLQNYQNLNYQGFRKIMKKHDKLLKVTSGNDWRQKHVDIAHFHTDKEIDRLINEVENLVTNELEHGDRAKAMKRLRVPPLTERTTSWDYFR